MKYLSLYAEYVISALLFISSVWWVIFHNRTVDKFEIRIWSYQINLKNVINGSHGSQGAIGALWVAKCTYGRSPNGMTTVPLSGILASHVICGTSHTLVPHNTS